MNLDTLGDELITEKTILRLNLRINVKKKIMTILFRDCYF